VVSENQRVLDAADAIRNGDIVRLGELFNASHNSQRDDYNVSVPEIDLLIELAREHRAVLGGRLSGGGFGGSVVLLVQAGQGAAVASDVSRRYERRSGIQSTTVVPPPPPTQSK
jgi:galactokinase